MPRALPHQNNKFRNIIPADDNDDLTLGIKIKLNGSGNANENTAAPIYNSNYVRLCEWQPPRLVGIELTNALS